MKEKTEFIVLAVVLVLIYTRPSALVRFSSSLVGKLILLVAIVLSSLISPLSGLLIATMMVLFMEQNYEGFKEGLDEPMLSGTFVGDYAAGATKVTFLPSDVETGDVVNVDDLVTNPQKYDLKYNEDNYIIKSFEKSSTVKLTPSSLIKVEVEQGEGYVINKVSAATDPVVATGHSKQEQLDNADWSAYLERYDDLKKAFGNDHTKARQHFIDHGFKEGRYAGPNPPTTGPAVSTQSGVTTYKIIGTDDKGAQYITISEIDTAQFATDEKYSITISGVDYQIDDVVPSYTVDLMDGLKTGGDTHEKSIEIVKHSHAHSHEGFEGKKKNTASVSGTKADEDVLEVSDDPQMKGATINMDSKNLDDLISLAKSTLVNQNKEGFSSEESSGATINMDSKNLDDLISMAKSTLEKKEDFFSGGKKPTNGVTGAYAGESYEAEIIGDSVCTSQLCERIHREEQLTRPVNSNEEVPRF